MPKDGGASPAAASRYLVRLHRAVAHATVPHGYTLTVWATGALLLNRFGEPGLADVLGFLAGASGAFVTMTAFTHLARAEDGALASPSLVPGMQVVATGLAASIAGAIAAVAPAACAWALAACASTSLYFALVVVRLRVGGGACPADRR